MLQDIGAVETAKKLIRKNTSGFKRLKDENRLDLSIEYYVVKEEYNEIFDIEDIEICKKKLGLND